MRLSYATEWIYALQIDKASNKRFPYNTHDLYGWYLKLGPAYLAKNYFKGRASMFTALIDNPDYTAHRRRQRWTDAVKGATFQCSMSSACEIGGSPRLVVDLSRVRAP